MTARQRCISAHLLLVLLLVQPRPLAPAVIVADGSICNLNAAILAANDDAPRGSCPAGSGADTIQLLSSRTLSVVDNDEPETDGPNGLPSVTSRITVEGSGETVARSSLASTPDFRIFHVGDAGRLTLKDLTVSNGVAEHGGGIFNRGHLVLHNTTVSSNRAIGSQLVSSPAFGGGIYNGNYARIRDSSIIDNEVWNRVESYDGYTYGEAFGGGIHSETDTVLKVETSTIEDNKALGGRDGLFFDGEALGGGIRAEGYLRISYSTISGNEANAYSPRGGGISATTASISHSTISGNEANAPFWSYSGSGGGISAGTVAISNSTISANTANWGGGISAKGTVDHSTLHGNEGTYGGASVSSFSDGLTIKGSILVARVGADHCLGPVIDGGGGNLADDGTCLPSFGSMTGIALALADNGGPTMTHRLLLGSTAVDTAPSGCGLGTDQRGAGRMGACDSGAFEYLGDGCSLRELENMTILGSTPVLACHTALAGPGFVVQGPLGDASLFAGFLVTLRNGVEVREGAEMTIGTDPSLLP